MTDNANDRLAEVVRHAAAEGPQAVEVEGVEPAMVLSRSEYERLRSPNAPKDLKAFLMAWPSLEEVDLRRDRDGDSERSW